MRYLVRCGQRVKGFKYSSRGSEFQIAVFAKWQKLHPAESILLESRPAEECLFRLISHRLCTITILNTHTVVFVFRLFISLMITVCTVCVLVAGVDGEDGRTSGQVELWHWITRQLSAAQSRRRTGSWHLHSAAVRWRCLFCTAGCSKGKTDTLSPIQ